ncbi:MAG: ammonia-forming cytochrome c nitrite reductase subunit c552 [Bacteroidota bacterium]|nr:ammonia-forming cytochrome c nitrite reductase subunit c552 [Bacteroidota bacterium]
MEIKKRYFALLAVSIILTIAVVGLLVNIFEHKQEGRITYLQLKEIPEGEPDPAVWRDNFPREYDSYIKTMRTSELEDYSKYGRYGGSESFQKLDKHPDYKRLFAGYPFGIDYKEERGHMNALQDMLSSQRLGDNKPGTCMSCKSPQVPKLIDSIGAEAFYKIPVKDLVEKHGFKHSVSCADCHDANTMDLKITRIAFKEAMERRGIDLSKADRQQMRTYVCAQCHVEYYFKGPGKYLTFPWDKGLNIDSIDSYYSDVAFTDWNHAETNSPMIKIQHPEFEFWSTGIHARSNVACADCHMPYKREGAIKITDHWIRTPLENISNTCLNCHRQSEAEMKSRVLEIQDKTYQSMQKSEKAILAAMDVLKMAMKSGVSDKELEEARLLHRKAQMRWDFISAENSMGFHSPQESARILADARDFARQAELSAFKILTKVTRK